MYAIRSYYESSLNKEKGGEIAENLSRLYFYCNSRLLMANLKLDVEAIEQVVNILKGLRSAYAEIRDVVPTQQAPIQSSAPQTARPINLGTAATAAATRMRQAGAYQTAAQQAPQQQPAAAPAAPVPPAETPEPVAAATGIPPVENAEPPRPEAGQTAPQPPLQAVPRSLNANLRRATAAYGSTSGS